MANNSNIVAQKQLEGNDQMFFFKHVRKQIDAYHEKATLTSALQEIGNKVDNNEQLDVPSFQLLGMFSFLLGMDYCQQPYIKKNIVAQVKTRFDELSITDDETNAFIDVLNKINANAGDSEKAFEYYKNLLAPACKKISDALTDDFKNRVKTEDLFQYNQIRAKLYHLLNLIQIPMGFAVGLIDIKSHPLTPESLLKANSLINEQGTYSGATGTKIVELYSINMFNWMLNYASDIFNENKFAILYEESIVNALETANRLGIVVNPEQFDDEYYATCEKNWNEKQIVEEPVPTTSDKKVRKYTAEETKDLMTNHPNQFVEECFEEYLGKPIETIEELIAGFMCIRKDADYLQHIYQYMAQNRTNEKRRNEHSNFCDNPEYIKVVDEKLKTASEKYKELVEFNCQEIPAAIRTKVINSLHDLIKTSIMKTADQKQYLLSELLGSGVTTFNHFQQIMSIIETCEILGADCEKYSLLYDYMNKTTKIKEVFENGEKLTELEVEMSMYSMLKDWLDFEGCMKKVEKAAEKAASEIVEGK